MAEIRDELILDISRALREVDELQRAIDRALTETEVSLDTTEAQAEANRIQDTLSQPIDVPLNITGEQALDDLNADLRTAEGGFEELRREADRTGDEIENVGDQARVAGRQMDDVGTRGGRAFNSLRIGIGVTAGALAAIAGARVLGNFFGDAINAASDLNESLGKTRIVFGDFSTDVEAFASTAPQALGLSEQAALEATATFGNLFLSLGLSKEAAAGLSPDIVQLAADLGSFNNIETGDALEKLRSGLVGETEPLRALDVIMNETVVQAKALELGLGGVTGELTEAEKVQARYAIILEQTGTAQGNFALTAEDTANSLKTLKAEFQTVLADVGTDLLPVFQELIEIAPELLAALTELAPVLVTIAKATGVTAIGIAEMTGAISDAEADQKRYTIQTGLAADSALLLKGSLFLAAEEVADFLRQSGKARGSDRLIAMFEGIIDASEATPEAIQTVIANLDELADQAGLTDSEVAALADLLQDRIANLPSDAFLNINTDIVDLGVAAAETVEQIVGIPETLDLLSVAAIGLGVSLGEIFADPTAFPELADDIARIPPATRDLVVAADEIFNFAATFAESNQTLADEIDIFGELPDAIKLSKEEFLANLRITAAEQAEFEANLFRLFVISPELAAAIADQKISARGLLADLLTDPAGIAEAEGLITGEATDLAVFATDVFSEALASGDIPGLIEFLNQMSSDSVVGPAVAGLIDEINRLLAAAGFNAPLTLTPVLGVIPNIPSLTSSGTLNPARTNQFFDINVTSAGDAATDGARIAQTVASVVRAI